MSRCLVLNFLDSNDKKINIYIPHVKDTVTIDGIMSVMGFIYMSPELFETPMKACIGAYYIYGKNDYSNAFRTKDYKNFIFNEKFKQKP